MTDTIQARDFDPTINFLQQDLATVDISLAINYIEQWEHQLQGTEFFDQLTELKQAILNLDPAEIQANLDSVSHSTLALADRTREDGAADLAAKIRQMGELLSQASHTAI